MSKERKQRQPATALGFTISGNRPIEDVTGRAQLAGEHRALVDFYAKTADILGAERRAIAKGRKDKHLAHIESITHGYDGAFRALSSELIIKKHIQDRLLAEHANGRGGKLARTQKRRKIQPGIFDVYDTIGIEDTVVLPLRMQFSQSADQQSSPVPITYTQLLQREGRFDDRSRNRVEVNFGGNNLDEIRINQVGLHLTWADELTLGFLESLPASSRYDPSLLYTFFKRIPHMANSRSHFIDIILSLPDEFTLAHNYFPDNGNSSPSLFEERCKYSFQPFQGANRFRPVHSSITNLQPSSYINTVSHGGANMQIPVWNPISPNPSGNDGYSEKSYQNLLGTLLGLVHFQES